MDFHSIIPLLDPQFINEVIEDKSSHMGTRELELGFESRFNCPQTPSCLTRQGTLDLNCINLMVFKNTLITKGFQLAWETPGRVKMLVFGSDSLPHFPPW